MSGDYNPTDYMGADPAPVEREKCQSCEELFARDELVRTTDGPTCFACMKDYVGSMTPEPEPVIFMTQELARFLRLRYRALQFVTRPSMDIALAIIRETEGKS